MQQKERANDAFNRRILRALLQAALNHQYVKPIFSLL